MQTSTRKTDFEFIDKPTEEDFKSGNIDFVYNGTTHKIYTEPQSKDDYFIHCLKDKVKVISTFMTLDLRHSLDYQATKEEIIEAYERRLM
jgi:hypothetical protein